MTPTVINEDDAEWIEESQGELFAGRGTGLGEAAGNETLRYLCFSTMREPEVLVYPDSDKIGVRGEAPGAPNKNLRADAEVDYWEGET
jgi:uncharacterized cupin superfamily protein